MSDSDDVPLLVVSVDDCCAMIVEAERRSGPHPVRSPENVALPIAKFSSRVFSVPPRRIAVFCTAGEPSPVFYAIDAVCYHGKADLSQGGLVQGVCDVEDLDGRTTPLCVECPGHGYLFSLATGSNIIRGARFENGKLTVGGLKAVSHMQRPYQCVFDPAIGLSVYNKLHRNNRFASDR